MRVTELMNAEPASCGPDANLAQAVSIMWEHDCGFVPVVDEKDRVVGVVTDRDIAIALGTRNRAASEMTVAETMSKRLHTCSLEDSVEQALDAMAANKIRRLPVIDRQGRLEGVVSMNDAILATGGPVLATKVLMTLRTISEHHRQLARTL